MRLDVGLGEGQKFIVPGRLPVTLFTTTTFSLSFCVSGGRRSAPHHIRLSRSPLVMTTRVLTRQANKREALEESSFQCIPAPCSKRPAAEQAADALPLLDDETAGIVMSYLPSACLGDR